MKLTARFWVVTEPQAVATGLVELFDRRKLVSDPLKHWPAETHLDLHFRLRAVFPKRDRAVVWRLSRAQGEFETPRCEIDIIGVGKIDGHFKIVETDDYQYFRRISAFVIVAPEKIDEVRFRPSTGRATA